MGYKSPICKRVEDGKFGLETQFMGYQFKEVMWFDVMWVMRGERCGCESNSHMSFHVWKVMFLTRCLVRESSKVISGDATPRWNLGIDSCLRCQIYPKGSWYSIKDWREATILRPLPRLRCNIHDRHMNCQFFLRANTYNSKQHLSQRWTCETNRLGCDQNFPDQPP